MGVHHWAADTHVTRCGPSERGASPPNINMCFRANRRYKSSIKTTRRYANEWPAGPLNIPLPHPTAGEKKKTPRKPWLASNWPFHQVVPQPPDQPLGHGVHSGREDGLGHVEGTLSGALFKCGFQELVKGTRSNAAHTCKSHPERRNSAAAKRRGRFRNERMRKHCSSHKKPWIHYKSLNAPLEYSVITPTNLTFRQHI